MIVKPSKKNLYCPCIAYKKPLVDQQYQEELRVGRGVGSNALFPLMSRKPVLAFNFGLTAHDLTFTFEGE